MSSEVLRLLILGAHPDDAEYHAGGLATLYRQHGHVVKMVSVTNGAAGHHWRSAEELAALRRQEAAGAGEVIGAVYETWDFPDGQLQPTLEVRGRIIREIRGFAPDLVLTHRTNDYHPDHRAVGQAVQDASYLVTVPLVVPEVPIIKQEPVVAYMADLFRKPCPLEPDVVLDIEPQFETIVRMLSCHRSQMFEFLPWNEGIADQVPEGEDARMRWLSNWYGQHICPRAERFREMLLKTYGPDRGESTRYVEAYETSEYAAICSDESKQRLFGFLWEKEAE